MAPTDGASDSGFDDSSDVNETSSERNDFMDAEYLTESEESSEEDSDEVDELDDEEQPLEKLDAIFDWYSRLHSRRVDIVGDYAGNELFLIEGDSILLECFSNKQLDFDPGFQLLHAVYAVENFLRGLVNRRCNFHIAFFDRHQELCIPTASGSDEASEKYLLARAVIIRHLQKNLSAHSGIQIHIFPSVLSEQFAEYLRETDLYFFMCNDGASSSTPEEKQATYREHDVHSKTLFRKIIYSFTQSGYSAALVNGIEWKDTKVVTTILESSHREGNDISLDILKTATSSHLADNYQSSDIDYKAVSDMTETLTERDLVNISALRKMEPGGVGSSAISSAFLRHLALLHELPLSERILAPAAAQQVPLAKFCKVLRGILEARSWQEQVDGLDLACDVADLIDGRLLSACLENKELGTGQHYDMLLEAAKSLSGAQSKNTVELSQHPSSQAKSKAVAQAKSYSVLPFSNDVFDKHLSPIKLKVNSNSELDSAISARIFREVSHWHNARRPLDPKSREDQAARNKKQKFFADRRNQWFMAEMMAYAASLTNAVGKVLEPETITAGGKAKTPVSHTPNKPEEDSNPKRPAKGGPKKKAPTNKEIMLAKIAAGKSVKDDNESTKILNGWALICDGLEKESKLPVQYSKAKQHLLTLNTELKREVLEAEIKMYMVNILLRMWIGYCKDDRKTEGLHVGALLFDSIYAFSKYRRSVTKAIANCLSTSITKLKLPPLAVPSADVDRKLSFDFSLNNVTVDVAIPLSETEFQLLYCGPYFERSMGSAPDPRTPFEPDAWQRKVLDRIDAKRSLLVVAPTSAGKTFISFYAMKQVLESGNDDILVYVAPTKALVNQIAAEVQARFSKRYTYGGNSVWGIHTRDYRINNPTGCQVLVTVPHILQIMLLSPSNAKSWSERVKWIIFDEVHCIGQADDGLIWEQLLLLAPCPIIALSATIGNPHEFSDWLTSTQKALGNDLAMIEHPHRYSDLRKFVYASPKEFNFEGLSEQRVFAKLGLDGCDGFDFLHPVASLIHQSRGVPSDLALEARDCYTLWKAMSKHQNEEFPLDPSLGPASLPKVITKVDVIAWQDALKSTLARWIADTKSPFRLVRNDLSGASASIGRALLDKEESALQLSDTGTSDDYKIEGILPLLSSLHEQDALPGIIFNYDRGRCEAMCISLLEQLTEAEARWKESSPKWQASLASWEAWKKAMAKTDKRGTPKVSKKKGGGKDEDSILSRADMIRDTASSEASPWASFDPNLPAEGFHFTDSKKLTHGDLNVYMKELIRREVPQWQLDGLRRGIGVHHAGMNRKYRQVVEMLFRKGFLRVVIATGTLALGINMPCKTVVFSGDSVFLTALNYRQAAGRAGRRGFDVLGNVVFHGIPRNKVLRLMSSRLPDLNGHFPITTTLVLRLFTLLYESKESPFAIRSINALLSQPRIYLGGDEMKMTVLHHLRFSIEYLRRQSLLDSRGAPLNFAGTVSHLYFTENSAFAFHALLKDGYFHRLCAKVDKAPDSVMRELMLTMAHLFGRQYCRQADEEFIKQVVKNSPSVVFLPPMPDRAAKTLRKHNQSTLHIFTAYVQTYVQQHLSESDRALPLTGIQFGGESVPESAARLKRKSPTAVRSPFVALSGHRDNFKSIHDLCTTARSGVFLEESVVPHVGLYPEESALPLNAYLYDFFKHGDTTALANANRIRRGDVWFVLNDFSMVLATIVTSFSNFLKLTPTSDLDLAEVRGEGDEEDERKEDKLLPDDSGYDTASTVSGPGGPMRGAPGTKTLPILTKKKAKVADSWDDADDADDDDRDFEAEAAARAKQEAILDEKPAWEEGTGLLNVLKAFTLLKAEFDTKFKAMWA
ncbi:P-loop containing nucleoside triphosphate hydrolase protein [Polyplosphaeria fusca]|uniref:P-loop containing nucleoside triphosphate hydrolase protein n=1 Tax=Polyplosphaeria fusca TaxID=682080 RepID=A0A9P4V3J2_9PLEO|nr:P-loop containing nucleoside triphosphate hydrolase protein [Polyplosphaeria fusca]